MTRHSTEQWKRSLALMGATIQLSEFPKPFPGKSMTRNSGTQYDVYVSDEYAFVDIWTDKEHSSFNFAYVLASHSSVEQGIAGAFVGNGGSLTNRSRRSVVAAVSLQHASDVDQARETLRRGAEKAGWAVSDRRLDVYPWKSRRACFILARRIVSFRVWIIPKMIADGSGEFVACFFWNRPIIAGLVSHSATRIADVERALTAR